MITKTSEKHLIRAVKTALRISDAKAREILDSNWFSLPATPLRGCAVRMEDYNGETGKLDIYVPGDGGYVEWVGTVRVESEFLANWNKLPIKEAYSLPEGVRTLQDSFDWKDGRIVNVLPCNDERIIVKIANDNDEVREMAMLTDMVSAQELVTYAMDKLNEKSRLCIEDTPFGKRAERSGGLPILEMVMAV